MQLNNGYTMPLVGLGTYALDDETCYNSVTALLNAGGRLIDTAFMYYNEAAIERALKTLNIGYIDLLLLHHPGEGDVAAYSAMEQAVKEGTVRSIGLSNWYIEELEAFLPQVTVKPALVQNEIHPYYQEPEVVPYILSLGITVQGWYPFGGRGHTQEMFADPVLKDIAAAHGVSVPQVILRWNLQRGVVVIPGSSNPQHIRENLALFGFELSPAEMEQIAALNRDEKHD